MNATESAQSFSPFATLAELRREHTALLKAVRESGAAQQLNDRLQQFIGRAKATGAVLDSPADRETAQGMLDYWAASLFTRAAVLPSEGAPPPGATNISPGNFVLADFDAAHAGKITAAAEDALKSMSQEDQELARKIVLSLVRLGADGRSFQLSVNSRGKLETLAEPARVRQILDRLQAAGVIHSLSGHEGDEQIVLAGEALTRTWSSLARWLDQRLRFRDTVRYWDKNSRNSAALISGLLLDEARGYFDLNATEREYVDNSRSTEIRHNQRLRMWVAALAVLLIIAVVGWLVAYRQAVNSEYERNRAVDAEKKLEKATSNKQFLLNMNLLVRSLAEVGTAANPGERAIALQRWNFATNLLREDERLRPFLENTELDRALKDTSPRSLEGNNEISRQSLKLARQLKAKALELNDPIIIAGLKDKRIVAFKTARFCAEQIVKSYQDQTYLNADPYKQEFWTLYYGELGFLAEKQVADAMLHFGTHLGTINGAMLSEATDSKVESSTHFPINPSDLKKLTSQQIVDKATTFFPKHKISIESVFHRKSKSASLAAHIRVLDALLHKELIPAFDAELKLEITTAEALPTGY